MEFTAEEKQAVISLMVGIIEADGWIDDEEIEFAQDVLDAIECTEEDFELGQDMPLLPALVILKRMSDEQKGVVSDVITATIVADRIITAEEAENVERSSRNIPGVKAINTTGLNVYDILNHDKLFVTKDAVARIEEVLA